MIELFEQNLRQPKRHSSKGNQFKWENDGIWYKADYMGYEGLAEYLVSHLLEHSTLTREEYIIYDLTQIRYKHQTYRGAMSHNLLTEDWQIVTLERLFKQTCGESLYEKIWKLPSATERLTYLTETIEQITGICDYGRYLAKLLTIDAFFLNEDRHLHNVAVLMNAREQYRLCPIFDNGACLLSDTKGDYPLDVDPLQLMGEVHARTISRDFDEQLDAAEQLYGDTIHFSFDGKCIDALLAEASIYPEAERDRVRTLLHQQMHKYGYLFKE